VQPLEIVRGRVADRGIKVPFALARGQNVPQAEAVREQARETVGVRQRVQVFVDQRADQFPELVDVLVNLTLLDPSGVRHYAMSFL